jgi:hypothetical protein
MSETKAPEQATLENEIYKVVVGFIAKPDKTIDIDKAKLALAALKSLSIRLVEAVTKELDKRQAEIDKTRAEFSPKP